MKDPTRLVHKGIQQLTPYVPGKPIEELEREYGITGAIKMASNENPLGPSPKAVAAIKDTLASLHRYPDADAFDLKQKLTEKFGYPRESILPVNGSNEILELCMKAFLRSGEETLMPDPSFSLYAKFTSAMGGIPVKVPLNDFTVDLKAMQEQVTSKTRIIFINNPNNPTGTTITKESFDTLLKAIPEDVIVILDEAYREFVTTPDSPCGEHYIDSPRWVITMRTFSKAYGLAGLRIGYGLASPGIIQLLNKVRQPFNVNLPAQTAALAALDDDDHYHKTMTTVSDGLTYFYEELDKLDIPYIPTQANYFMVHVRKSCDDVYEAMLRQGVIIRPLTSFGYNDYIRITVGTPKENARCLAVLKDVLK